MTLIQKVDWEIIQQSKDKKYQYLFKKPYKDLENYHLTKFKWKTN